MKLLEMTCWEPDSKGTQVHIVVGDSFAGSMKIALKQLGWEDTHRIISFRDNYAIGPLWKLQEEIGRSHRREWFRDHIYDEYGEYAELDDFLLMEQFAAISAQADITIWTGNNAPEQVGLRLAMYLLRNMPNPIRIKNAADAYSHEVRRRDTTGLRSAEISADQLKSIVNKSGKGIPLTKEERGRLVEEWYELSLQPEVLRIWKDREIVNVAEDYYDVYILKKVNKLHQQQPQPDFMKSARVIGEVIGYLDQQIGDEFFEYRLRYLAYNGQLETKGIPGAMRRYSIRKKASPSPMKNGPENA
ncbi:DUF1835 domain-containing protein [Paenibacillus brasilensis]|uniref:DUF1835 domain-containing protein n=1 Tax=Paenibacillus brasilensis TaxID=128574 RepID=A0ABU0L5S4_9BACL|nr:DUF1835 domain-containing protein [Paenibacillus brasilensis]MDQ0496620.1 hypothetical protein [Paenibacillus brasilensis]